MNTDLSNPAPTPAGSSLIQQLDWDKGNGLLPAIVQHADTGQVLMLAYMNSTALEQTTASGKVTFYSRSRQQLWQKGETSGHILELIDIQADCDNDTLLIQARPTGPVCHRLTPTCFDHHNWPRHAFISELEAIIQNRQQADPEQSYTARLLAEPLQRLAQKVGEEGVETALAAVAGDNDELANEAADLIYHLLVLLTRSGLSLAAVNDLLCSRHRQTDT